MPLVNVDDLELGMTLAADVLNLHGQLIAPCGIKVEDKHIRVIKAWGIPKVSVNEAQEEDPTQDVLSKIPPKQLQELKEQLDEIFHESNREEIFIKTIYDLCLERKAVRSLGKGHHASRT